MITYMYVIHKVNITVCELDTQYLTSTPSVIYQQSDH